MRQREIEHREKIAVYGCRHFAVLTDGKSRLILPRQCWAFVNSRCVYDRSSFKCDSVKFRLVREAE